MMVYTVLGHVYTYVSTIVLYFYIEGRGQREPVGGGRRCYCDTYILYIEGRGRREPVGEERRCYYDTYIFYILKEGVGGSR